MPRYLWKPFPGEYIDTTRPVSDDPDDGFCGVSVHEVTGWQSAEIERLERAAELDDENATNLHAAIVRLQGILDRGAEAWMKADLGIAWEGDLGNAMIAAVEEVNQLRVEVAKWESADSKANADLIRENEELTAEVATQSALITNQRQTIARADEERGDYKKHLNSLRHGTIVNGHLINRQSGGMFPQLSGWWACPVDDTEHDKCIGPSDTKREAIQDAEST